MVATLPVPPPGSQQGSKGGGRASKKGADKAAESAPPAARRRKDTEGNTAEAPSRTEIGSAIASPAEGASAAAEASEGEQQPPKGNAPGRRQRSQEEKEAISKKKGQALKLNNGVKQLLKDILKSVLSVQQAQRSLDSVVFDVILVEETNPAAIGMAEQGRAYAAVQDKSNIGSPHLFVFGGLLQAVVGAGEKIGQANLLALTKALEEYGLAEQEEKGEMILFAKMERTFKPNIKRVILSIERAPFRRFLINALQQLGGERRQGRAPRGAQERGLEQWLAALVEM